MEFKSADRYSLTGSNYECEFSFFEGCVNFSFIKIESTRQSKYKENIQSLLCSNKLSDQQLMNRAAVTCVDDVKLDLSRSIVSLRRHFLSEKNTYDGFTGLNREQFLVGIKLLRRFERTSHFDASSFYYDEVVNLCRNVDLGCEDDLAAIRDSIFPDCIHDKIDYPVNVFTEEIWPSIIDLADSVYLSSRSLNGLEVINKESKTFNSEMKVC